MTPKRIQRKRTKGWRMPGGAVYVGRPTRWGNPFVVSPMSGFPGFFDVTAPGYGGGAKGRRDAHQLAVDRYRELLRDLDRGQARPTDAHPLGTYAEIREHLAGRDLACWCPVGFPCHADVLLEIANQEARP